LVHSYGDICSFGDPPELAQDFLEHEELINLQTYFWRFTKSAYFGDPRISVQKFYSIEQAAFSTIITSFS